MSRRGKWHAHREFSTATLCGIVRPSPVPVGQSTFGRSLSFSVRFLLSDPPGKHESAQFFCSKCIRAVGAPRFYR